MLDPKHLLIAIDGSEASLGAVRHAAALLYGTADPHITLMHVLSGAPPPELREHPGSEDPARERELGVDLQRRRQEWLAEARQELDFFERARAILKRSGVPESAVETVTVPTDQSRDVALRVLETAHNLSCGTVVVGRSSQPWYKELLKSHLSEQLLAQDDVAVLVVP